MTTDFETSNTETSSSEDSETSNSEASESLTGYELVASLMERQEEVITQLDSLNDRIESAIKEISEARKLEEQGIAAKPDTDPATAAPQAA